MGLQSAQASCLMSGDHVKRLESWLCDGDYCRSRFGVRSLGLGLGVEGEYGLNPQQGPGFSPISMPHACSSFGQQK